MGVRRGFRVVPTILLVAAACTGSPATEAPLAPEGRRWALREACSVPRAQLQRIRDGYRPGRSGDVQFLAAQPGYFDEHSHSGPWPYLQRVPVVLYGSGHVAPDRVERPITLADLAPTMARLLGYRFPAADGRPIPEAEPTATSPPRLVVVVVWDGGGRGVLAEHPGAWPTLRRLARGGLWFERATVGSSPSVSPAIHATLSTGASPRRHGLVDMVFRARGRMMEVTEDPTLLRLPTLADRYDRTRRNRPVVGLVGHPLILGMLGHGSAFPGGDRDLVAIEGERGWQPPEGGAHFFRFPSYAPGDVGTETASPEFARQQTRLIEDLIRRDAFGKDEVPDLLLVNYNQINEVGHHWSMNSPRMAEAVRASDRALRSMVRILDLEVGTRRWVLAVTADHGSTPDVSVTGGFAIDSAELTADIRAAFGDAAVVDVRVTQAWVDRDVLAEAGRSPSDVAWFLRRYTRGDNVPDPDSLLARHREARAFDAAFPSSVLRRVSSCPSGD